jgi:hypothetical protein|tara:strand:- start:9641 stop:10090 length:450 start_codon:yes stop_codon:yes gene_type:complete
MAVAIGKAYWTSVTVPNETFEPVYTVDLVISDEDAQDFNSRGVKVKDFSLKDETGEPQFIGKAVTIKRKVNAKNGKRPAPKLYNLNKEPMDVTVGNGSAVKVQYNEFAWDYAGKSGVSLDFQAMQVLDLVPVKSQDGDELNPFGDGEEF